MANKRKGSKRANKGKKKATEPMQLPTMRPNAAGIDIGTCENVVCVPADRDEQPIQSFSSFTSGLMAVVEWLNKCGIDTVAMESTGVYWIPLYQILSERGFEVYLVNSRHHRNVAGRPTDAGDAQWLQFLHSVGLVKGSFRPDQSICALRTLLRHRDNLVKAAATISQQIQKSLDQMNVKLHYVLSDILGVSGMAILDALLSGVRDPEKLAQLCDPRVKASPEQVTKSLEGDFRAEHTFVLEQSLRMYRYYHDEIARLDKQMEQFMAELPPYDPNWKSSAEKQAEPESEPGAKRRGRPKKAGTRKARPRKQGGHGNEPDYNLAEHCHRIAGVDLTAIPGFGPQTAHVILTEVGPDLSAFPTSGNFCSWLRLCPYREITGGKVMSSKTRKSANRAANALRVAAQTLHNSQSHLGGHLRKMKGRQGSPEAITSTAHKMARIVYHLLTTKEAYDESVLARNDQQYQKRLLKRLENAAKAKGFQLVPIPPTEPSRISVH